MATYIKTLSDKDGNVILPRTRSSAVYMSDNSTLEDKMIINNKGYVTLNTSSLIIKQPNDVDDWSELNMTCSNGRQMLLYLYPKSRSDTKRMLLVNRSTDHSNGINQLGLVFGSEEDKTKDFLEIVKSVNGNYEYYPVHSDGYNPAITPNRTGIVANTDFNNITTPGYYVCGSDKTLATCANSPWTVAACILEVIEPTPGGIVQIAKGVGAVRYSQRYRSPSNVWSAWYASPLQISQVNGLVLNENSVLSLSSASATSAGAVTTGAQTFNGNKTFTGAVYPRVGTAYTSYEARRIGFSTSIPSSLNNGEICLVYQ